MAATIIKASFLYWVLAFAVGWVFGPLRELFVVPRFGRTVGILLEVPLMTLAMIVAARWTLRWLSVPSGAAPWMGLGALSLLCAAEVAGIWWVRGLSMASYLATFTPVSATMSLLMLGLFAIMPILIARGR